MDSESIFLSFLFFSRHTLSFSTHLNALPRFVIKLNQSTRDTTWRACRREHWMRSERGSANLHVITSISLSRWLPPLLCLRQSMMFTQSIWPRPAKKWLSNKQYSEMWFINNDYILHRQEYPWASSLKEYYIFFPCGACHLWNQRNETAKHLSQFTHLSFCENPPNILPAVHLL